jgi:predicted metal-dependent HD superfamily phosphohydrolase
MILQNKKDYPEVCLQILEDLKKNLPDHLSYHSIDHIIDVANICDNYISYYDIPKNIAKLIRIAAISHDYGYMDSPIDHEEKSILNIQPYITPYLSQNEIDIVSGLIRATKVPQQPKTRYEQILADADLDYLGRKDYDELSTGLFKEFLHFGVVQNEEEWLDLQIKFLESHKFHTSFAKENRTPLKAKKLKELKQRQATYST